MISNAIHQSALYKDIDNLKSKNIEDLQILCAKIRERILEVVSKNGGHLSSTLGATELIVAMHFVFDCSKDPFIFDVSHQAYAHKLLTNRWKEFETLRQTGGISGFIKPTESPFDYFIAGHSSTSISLGLGAAKAIALKKEERLPVVLIGDGSLSSGICYEALNELGDRKYPLIIILNDNEMSIAEPIGAISKYLSQAIAGHFFQTLKAKAEPIFKKLPQGATYMAKRFEESLKLITPGLFFEELGLEYIGPIDGHNLNEIIDSLRIAQNLKKPIVIHAQTTKGKGYQIAEGHHEMWHGVSPFDIESGKALSSGKKSPQSPTNVFSKTLLELAQNDEKIIGVTAAMPSGTGLDALIKEYPQRFWDVAIAEAHATTSMAAAAKEGLKPFVTIYSTFLQRAFDSLIHDVGIMGLPVRFMLDRAGIVGEDGETHQGLFDIAYLRLIPNFTLCAPFCNAQLQEMLGFAANFNDSPLAMRYPRKSFIFDSLEDSQAFCTKAQDSNVSCETLESNTLSFTPTHLGKGQILLENPDSPSVFIGYGNGVGRAYKLIKKLQEQQQPYPTLVDLRFVKPLDEELLSKLNMHYKRAYVFSDNSIIGGVASAILEWQAKKAAQEILKLSDSLKSSTLGNPTQTLSHSQMQIFSFEFQDAFIPHGKTEEIEKQIKMDTQSLLESYLAYETSSEALQAFQ